MKKKPWIIRFIILILSFGLTIIYSLIVPFILLIGFFWWERREVEDLAGMMLLMWKAVWESARGLVI